MSKTIQIGTAVYRTKKAAGDAIRVILYAYAVGTTVTDEHAEFLANLLELHPERDDKVGVGIQSFQVEQNVGSRGFWITRKDRTRTDFSFLSCLTPPTAEAEARAGLRNEIRDQITAFRNMRFATCTTIPCEVSGEPVTSATAHVDHEPTFDELHRRFLADAGILLAGVSVEPTRDGETATRLADRALADAWSRFHRTHARLRIVSRRANLSLLRRRS